MKRPLPNIYRGKFSVLSRKQFSNSKYKVINKSKVLKGNFDIAIVWSKGMFQWQYFTFNQSITVNFSFDSHEKLDKAKINRADSNTYFSYLKEWPTNLFSLFKAPSSFKSLLSVENSSVRDTSHDQYKWLKNKRTSLSSHKKLKVSTEIDISSSSSSDLE